MTTVFKEMLPKPKTQTSSTCRQISSPKRKHAGGKDSLCFSSYLYPSGLNFECLLVLLTTILGLLKWENAMGEKVKGCLPSCFFLPKKFPSVEYFCLSCRGLFLFSFFLTYIIYTLPLRFLTLTLCNEGFLRICSIFWNGEENVFPPGTHSFYQMIVWPDFLKGLWWKSLAYPRSSAHNPVFHRDRCWCASIPAYPR